MSMLIFVLAILVVICSYACTDKDVKKDSFSYTFCSCINVTAITSLVIVLMLSIL